jgi:hypothetical protein
MLRRFVDHATRFIAFLSAVLSVGLLACLLG